jgi:hypothetical protein
MAKNGIRHLAVADNKIIGCQSCNFFEPARLLKQMSGARNNYNLAFCLHLLARLFIQVNDRRVIAAGCQGAIIKRLVAVRFRNPRPSPYAWNFMVAARICEAIPTASPKR